LVTLLQWAVIGRLEENIRQAQREVEERQRAEKSLQQRADEMALLYQMGLALTSGEDLYNALRALVKELKRLMVVDAFHVGLYDESSDIFQYSLFLNLDEDSQPPPRKLSNNPGLTWEVISKRQTLYLPDITDPATQHTHHIILIRDVGMHSYIGIPLVLADRVVGVMSVQALAPGAYTPEQIRFLETLAAQVAITVEKSRLFTNVQQRAAQLATMNEIGRAVSMLQDIETVFEIIYRQVQQIASVDAFYVGLRNSEDEYIDFPLMYDMGVRYSEPKVSSKASPWIEQVLHTSQPFMLHRTLEELQMPTTHAMGYTQRRSASILIVPLWLGQSVFGVLSIQSYTLNAYNKELANILTGIGHQAAIAIENARLLTNLQQELIERQRAETQLQTSLKEKEVLLKEVHHRVKNNMQVIVSMINLQSNYIEDPSESQNRVRSMALVHEKLYQSSNLAQIDFRDYLHHLASTLFHSYSPNISHIDLVIEVKECILSVDVAIPCGLIVNELISNALKHGFSDNRPGRVVVSLRQIGSGQLELAVTDNGVGIPVEKDWRKTESLGMQLVQSLAKQLQGAIVLERLQPGTRFILTFATPEVV
jgi:two-component sensor histidine kinase/putative methionine-R-sulfoxide reductase with GAF domain